MVHIMDWIQMIQRNINFLLCFMQVRMPCSRDWIDRYAMEDKIGAWENETEVSMEYLDTSVAEDEGILEKEEPLSPSFMPID